MLRGSTWLHAKFYISLHWQVSDYSTNFELFFVLFFFYIQCCNQSQKHFRALSSYHNSLVRSLYLGLIGVFPWLFPLEPKRKLIWIGSRLFEQLQTLFFFFPSASFRPISKGGDHLSKRIIGFITQIAEEKVEFT